LCCPMAALSSSSKALALASPSFRRPTSTSMNGRRQSNV
jgi:hypothetical protein